MDSSVSSQDTQQSARVVRIISRITAVLVSLLAILSFLLSYDSLHAFAESSGALAPGRAWLFPLIVDGAIIVFSVGALRGSLVGDTAKWPMALVVITTGLSIVFNIAHAPGGFMTCLVSATPPLLLFLAFELLMRQIALAIPATSLPQFSETPLARQKAPAPKKQPTMAPRSGNTPDKSKAEALRLLAAGTSKRSVAKQTNLALTTVRRLAASLPTLSTAA